jgi:phosphoglycolate phosphatase-like HAD superfamily hydrolase
VRSNGHDKPVVALDLDGTLGDYHRNFIEFARRYFNNTESNWMAPNPGLPLWEFMGISHRDYRDAKLAYRQGGWKRWMPCYPMAADMTDFIRQQGAEVWLCTTRPYLRLDNVDPDTREWLRRNKIQYDALLFDPAHEEDGTKYHELYSQAGDRVASIVDDLPEMIQAAQHAFRNSRARQWLLPILREQPYNGTFKWDRRAKDLREVLEMVLADIRVWRGWNAGA